jgi:hypothetical protein
MSLTGTLMRPSPAPAPDVRFRPASVFGDGPADHYAPPISSSNLVFMAGFFCLLFLDSIQSYNVLRDLCITHPSFNIYHDVSHLLSFWTSQSQPIRKSQKGLHATSQKIMFGVIVFMFSLSTAYLAVSIADLIILIRTWYLVQGRSDSAGTRSPSTEALLTPFNALASVNVGGRSHSHIDC